MEAETLKKVQARLLEMADTVTGILEKNNIRYMLAYGSLLGAVRHGGFIPWDDDFDLWLFEEDYERALMILRSELPSDLLIHDRKTDPIYWKAWSSVMDLRSEAHCSFHPDDNALRYKGLTLDLFPIRKMQRREVSAYLDRENMAFLVRKLDSGTMERGVFEEKFNAAALHYADVLRSIERGEGSTEEVYAFIIFLHGVTPDSILPLRRYTFEGREFWGPNSADAVLTECYNDYMALPAPEKRKSHYDRVDFFD